MVLALGFLLLVPAQQAHAQENLVSDFQATDSIATWCGNNLNSVINAGMCVFGLMTSALLELITWALGLFTLLVIEVLIAFASYNGFADAQIVQTGWRIVRDITNMFFIVILLVSAFATIIGYDTASFHYKRVLPKLLLMAVLVNFSLTIIQLLVDFSQVIMLTFVNAFQQAAAGNFVNGLGMTDVLRLPGSEEASASGGSAPQINLVNIILSLMLAVVLLTIMLATMIILTLYLIVRIVGIWVALIFSPAAFLATALPQRIGKYMGQIGQEYWGRLMGLLTGGPVIAFFLWLTLSTVQQAGENGLAPALNLASDNEAIQFLISSGAGNSNHIASFIIGVTLMMMGVGVAVKASQQASSTFGSIAGRIAGAGQQIGGRLAVGAAAAPAAAIGYGAYRGARAVDRRADITGRASRLGLRTLGRVPGVGAALRPALLRGATFRRREAAAEGAAEAKETLGYTKFLSPEEQQMVAEVHGKKALPTMADKVAREDLIAGVTSPAEMQKLQKSKATKLRQGLERAGVDKEEAKRRADLRAQEDVAQASGALLKEGLGQAQESGDFDAVEKYQKQLAENPLLHTNNEDIAKQMEKMRTDPDKLAGMNKEAKQSFSVALNALPTGAMQLSDDGNTVEGFDQPALERFYEQNAGNKELVDTVKQAVSFVQNSEGLGVNKEELLSMHKRRASDGSMKVYGKVMEGDNAGQFEQKHDQRYTNARNALQTSFQGGGGVNAQNQLEGNVGNQIDTALRSGVPITEIVGMTDDNQRTAISSHLGDTSQEASFQAAQANTKAELDQALGEAVDQWQQLDKVDSDMQVRILSKVQEGQGASTIAQKWNLADSGQRRAMQNVVKQAVRRAAEVARKRAAGQEVNAQEEQVEQLVSELREEMPRSRVGNTPAAPAAIRRVLHEERE